MQRTYIGSNGKEIGVLRCGGGGSGVNTTIVLMRQGQEDNDARPAQARQGQCNNGGTIEVTKERENS
jgi:hypothetical protein